MQKFWTKITKINRDPNYFFIMAIQDQKMYVYLTEVPAGKGTQDYETYMVRMSRLSWPRTLMLEHFPSEEYLPAKAHIEATEKKVGVTIYAWEW